MELKPICCSGSPECNGDRRSVRVVTLGNNLWVVLVDPAGVVFLLAHVVHEVPLVILRAPDTPAARATPSGTYDVQLVKLKWRVA